jgi:hypothetical protein
MLAQGAVTLRRDGVGVVELWCAADVVFAVRNAQLTVLVFESS